jgi:hypothetical protein
MGATNVGAVNNAGTSPLRNQDGNIDSSNQYAGASSQTGLDRTAEQIGMNS